MAWKPPSLETRFLDHVRAEGGATVEAGQFGPALGLAPADERQLLSRMSRRGLLRRVKRGLYLVRAPLSAEDDWGVSEARMLSTLMENCGGQYQLCGLDAFNYYHWSEQVPAGHTLYNDRLSGNRLLGGSLGIKLIKVTSRRLGGLDPIITPQGWQLNYPSKARALMDAVQDWHRFGSLPEAYWWAQQEIAADDAMPVNLVETALRYANQGALRRIGALLQLLDVGEPLLRRLRRGIKPAASLVPWIPARLRLFVDLPFAGIRPRVGADMSTIKRSIRENWGVILNGK